KGKETGEREQAMSRAAPMSDTAAPEDMVEEKVPVNLSPEVFEQHAQVELRKRGRREFHVDLSIEEYAPDEIARMLGTSLEVVMHAIWQGELRAQRAGRDVVCVKHADVVNWLRRRG